MTVNVLSWVATGLFVFKAPLCMAESLVERTSAMVISLKTHGSQAPQYAQEGVDGETANILALNTTNLKEAEAEL
jgi:hypothetical protein